MLHLYNDKQDIPEGIEYVRDNVQFFMDVTYNKLDERVNGLLKNTDGAVYLNPEQFTDKWGNTVSWLDLSTGGKTVLNIFYNENYCFDTLECGRNALTDLKNLRQGRAFPDYICNLDGIDECDVIVDDWDDYHYTSYERWKND